MEDPTPVGHPRPTPGAGASAVPSDGASPSPTPGPGHFRYDPTAASPSGPILKQPDRPKAADRVTDGPRLAAIYTPGLSPTPNPRVTLGGGATAAGGSAAQRIYFHPATVFIPRPPAPPRGARQGGRDTRLMFLWVCGGSFWVLLIGLWLCYKAWASVRRGERFWAVGVGFVAAHITFMGGKGFVWGAQRMYRTTTMQAQREKALAQWKED